MIQLKVKAGTLNAEGPKVSQRAQKEKYKGKKYQHNLNGF